jgi:hypothetical protein
MFPVEFNWLAVAVSAVISYVLGALWYSPLLLGKPWIAAHGFTDEQLQQMQQSGPMPYVLTAIAHLTAAIVISALVDYANVLTLVDGLWFGLLLWLGVAAVAGLIMNQFSDRKFSVFLIDTSYHLAYTLIIAVIVTVWR